MLTMPHACLLLTKESYITFIYCSKETACSKEPHFDTGITLLRPNALGALLRCSWHPMQFTVCCDVAVDGAASLCVFPA